MYDVLFVICWWMVYSLPIFYARHGPYTFSGILYRWRCSFQRRTQWTAGSPQIVLVYDSCPMADPAGKKLSSITQLRMYKVPLEKAITIEHVGFQFILRGQKLFLPRTDTDEQHSNTSSNHSKSRSRRTIRMYSQSACKCRSTHSENSKMCDIRRDFVF